MARTHWLALGLLLVALLIFGLGYCSRANIPIDPTATPAFPVSATPSDTPEPATATPSATVAPVTLTAEATGTAVNSSPPPTAVPSPTPTSSPAPALPTPTFTATPMPTERPSSHTVQRGDNLSWISEFYCGRQQWQWIYRANADRIRDPNLIFSGQRFVLPWPCPR